MIPLRAWAAPAVVVLLALAGWYVHSLRADVARLTTENAGLRATIAADQESARLSAQAAESRYQAALAKARKAAPRAAQRARDATEVLAYVPTQSSACAATSDVVGRVRDRLVARMRDDDTGSVDPRTHPVPDGGRRAAGAGDGG